MALRITFAIVDEPEDVGVTGSEKSIKLNYLRFISFYFQKNVLGFAYIFK